MNLPQTYLYSLGPGCFCYSCIPKELRSPSLFKAGSPYFIDRKFPDKFLPLSLFDGTFEKLWFDRDNWELYSHEASPSQHAILDIRAKNKKLQMFFGHLQYMPDFFDVDKVKKKFEFFREYSHFQFFVIDCIYYGHYLSWKYEAFQEFESYLLSHNYDLENFAYVALSNRDYHMLEALKIKTYVVDIDKHFPENSYTENYIKHFYVDYNSIILEKIEKIKNKITLLNSQIQ